jgi:hypothetical protein
MEYKRKWREEVERKSGAVGANLFGGEKIE